MQPLLVEDTKNDYRFDVDKIIGEDTRNILSIISAPLIVGNKALGILRVDSTKEKQFTTEDLRSLTTISDLGAVAIENAQLYERVEQLAIRDSLTGLYLLRYLADRMPTEMSRQLRRNKEMSFLMIDLDKFKQYNDNFGHVAGDIVLKTVSMILTDIFKDPGNLVCRYGGEEFCVMIPDCSKAEAVSLAEKFRRTIEEQSILLRREKTHITVSVGVATYPKDAQTKNDLIQKADEALYKAKNSGRNRVCSVLESH
jgi:diguanylate cyclase (GGDEF)-like protein